MTKSFAKIAALLTTTFLLTGTALALPSAPSLKPERPNVSQLVEKNQFAILQDGLDAADAGRWQSVKQALARQSAPAAAALLRWELAKNADAGMSFTDIQKAQEEFKSWPDQSNIRANLERTIASSNLTANQRIEWLKAAGPQTGEGVLALADAYHSQAMEAEMLGTIKEAWATMRLNNDLKKEITNRYPQALDAETHYRRADMLVWRGRISEARTLLSKLSSDRRSLIDARIALRTNRRGIDSYVNKVPSEFADDPALLHERARWRERRGRDAGQLELLVRIDGRKAAPVGRHTIWNEKHAEVRRLIKEGDHQSAYLLTINHGMTSGEGFRDSEWTAGWIALSFLNEPEKAEAHFRTFTAGVSTPISVARGQYWLGEALAAQQRTTESETAYLAAAKHNYVYYGQLAAEKVKHVRPQVGKLAFAATPTITEAERTQFNNRLDIRAAKLLAETGRLRQFERFSNSIDDTLKSEAEHQMLFDVADSYLHMRAAVRGGKAGLSRGLISPDAVYPILNLPRSTRNGAAEEAMVLALSRQESEFYPRAVSSANARGLMQMVPRYARAEARKVGVPFRESWLIDDPTYNLRLGRGFLDELVDQFNGSYILAAAAYNAGPSRANQWIRDYGDPRDPATNTVDWIESIPFAETRNYVQRVLENTQVYRHRLSGQPVDVRLMSDIKRGQP